MPLGYAPNSNTPLMLTEWLATFQLARWVTVHTLGSSEGTD